MTSERILNGLSTIQKDLFEKYDINKNYISSNKIILEQYCLRIIINFKDETIESHLTLGIIHYVYTQKDLDSLQIWFNRMKKDAKFLASFFNLKLLN